MTGKQACAWCNETQSCRDISIVTNVCSSVQSCPVLNETIPFVPQNLTTNDETTTTYSILGGIAGAVVIGGAVAGGVLNSQRRRNKDIFDTTAWTKAAQVNPLYVDRTQKFENPLYEARKYDEDEDEGY